MSVKCSAKQIADFVAFWGMTETFPQYCEYAEDARNLKSLDLITSTLNIFVEAFSSNFENIYREYKVNFPLSEEKFIEFLKPRCLLLTKDNKCFNFMLVCAFVYDIIHSFSYYNKCFHLVKVASKCLAAILKNRFKGIFKTDSGWEELMSFCIKIHGLVYPAEKVCESVGDQVLWVMTDNMDASFLNIPQGLEELSVEKYATISDNDDESYAKMSIKETNASLMNDSNTETETKELEDLKSSESPTSTDAQHALHSYVEGSLKSEKIPDENNTREDNDKNFIRNSSLPALSVTSAVTQELDQIICPKGNLTLSFEEYSAIKKVTEGLEDLRNLGFPSTEASHTFQLRILDFPPKMAEGEDENDSATDITSLPESAKEIANIDSKKTSNNIKEDNEKHDQMNLKKHLTMSFDDYLSMKKVIERLEDLCNLGFSSTDASQALQLKIEDLSPKKAEEKESTYDGADVRKNKDCAMDMTDSSLPKLTKESTDNFSGKTAIENNENLNESIDFKKNLTLSYEDYLFMKNVTERLEHLCNLGLHSTIPSFTDSSPKENKEKIYTKNDGKKNNEDCVIVDSSISDLAQDITNTTVNNEDGDTKKLDQMIGFQKHLILLFEKKITAKKMPETLHLYNFDNDSSTGSSHTFQLKCEDLYPNAENISEDKEKGVDKNNAKDSNVDVTDSLVPDLSHDLTQISIGKKPKKKIVKQKPGEMGGCRKKLILPISEDSIAQSVTKKLASLHNLESSSSPDVSHTLKDKEFSSKNEFEDNEEPFNTRITSAEKIRARITENPQHLSEIMDLLKKCEENIAPNMFSPEEYDIPIDDSDEDEELDASGGTSKSSSIGDQTIFESNIETMVFAQNMKMAHSVKRIFSDDHESDDETLPKASGGVSTPEMSDEYSNKISEFEDPRCSLCANGMVNFFDTCVLNFAKKYSNNNHVTDLFRCDFHEDSE